MNTPQPPDQNLKEWIDSLPDLPGIRPLDRLPAMTTSQQRRASYRRRLPPDNISELIPEQKIISLVEENGVLRWRAGVTASGLSARRAGVRAALPGGKVVRQYAFEQLAGSDVAKALGGLDQKLTPEAAYIGNGKNGLRRWRQAAFQPFPDSSTIAGKKVLLFIHGTFSSCEALLSNGLNTTSQGAKLLADAEKHYDLVLAYDHPTMGVSPALNAFDLAALLRPSPASLDIICHSRGGLVTRWFNEAFADPALQRRAVLVGCPLAGTSLAAAPKLRSSLDFITNIANFLRTGANLASAANTLFVAASGILRVIGAVTDLVTHTPVMDAVIALIPGLCAQAHVGNNEEIRRLRANTGNANFTAGPIRYFAIQSNFEPKSIGWNFLQWFSRPLQRLTDFGADMIFEGPNDLVVDTSSMKEVADNAIIPIAHDFGTSDKVHHLNYFHQQETVAAIRKSLAIPA
jgi:hypothetical protein